MSGLTNINLALSAPSGAAAVEILDIAGSNVLVNNVQNWTSTLNITVPEGTNRALVGLGLIGNYSSNDPLGPGHGVTVDGVAIASQFFVYSVAFVGAAGFAFSHDLGSGPEIVVQLKIRAVPAAGNPLFRIAWQGFLVQFANQADADSMAHSFDSALGVDDVPVDPSLTSVLSVGDFIFTGASVINSPRINPLHITASTNPLAEEATIIDSFRTSNVAQAVDVGSQVVTWNHAGSGAGFGMAGYQWVLRFDP